MTIDAINLTHRLAALSTGEVVPITNLFGSDGAEVDDANDAVSFVAGSGNCWFSDVVESYSGAVH